jgi:hypothetical protein
MCIFSESPHTFRSHVALTIFLRQSNCRYIRFCAFLCACLLLGATLLLVLLHDLDDVDAIAMATLNIIPLTHEIVVDQKVTSQ